MRLSRREESRTNGWVGALAVEPTCPTMGPGWGAGGWQRHVVLDIDGPPGWSVQISEFVFESGPVSSRVKGRAIVTAEGPSDPTSTTGYFDIRSGERSAIYRLVGAMSRMKSGRTVLDCTGLSADGCGSVPVSTWIRLTVDETTAVVYVQQTRLPSEGR